MRPFFADTSFYVALLGKHDYWHTRAVTLSADLLGHVITTEYALVEAASMLCKGKDRLAYGELVHELERNPRVLIVPASQKLVHAGLELFNVRQDKEWSLVDCISFVVMKQRRLTDALSTDHHFEQAGYRALLR